MIIYLMCSVEDEKKVKFWPRKSRKDESEKGGTRHAGREGRLVVGMTPPNEKVMSE